MSRTDPDRSSPAVVPEGSAADLPVVIEESASVVLDPEAAALVRRLRRVQGQVAGLAKMVETGRDCGDIITQLSAAEHALHRVGFLLVVGEMRKCGTTAGEDGERDAEARIAAAEKLFLRLA
ncbi:MAG TPA: metal-sensitive transcriptional regulator [Nocardioidaceae bacterium]